MIKLDYGFCGICGQHYKSHLTEHINKCDDIKRDYPKYPKSKHKDRDIVVGSIEDFVYQTGRYPDIDDDFDELR